MRNSAFLRGTLVIAGIGIFLAVIALGGESGLAIAVILLALGGIALLWSIVGQLREAFFRPAQRLYARDFSLKFFATLMGLFLIIGTLMFMYVFRQIGSAPVNGHVVRFSNTEHILRSVICSLELFMLNVDGNIYDHLNQYPALKGWISVQTVLSFSCTVAVLLGLVYSRLSAYLRLSYGTHIGHSHSHLYLFFGNNHPSQLLARDIMRKDPKAVVVIIDEANVSEDDNDEWSGIVGLMAHKRKVFMEAQKMGAKLAIASQQFDDIDDDITTRPDFDAFGYLGLTKIRQLIQRLHATPDPQLHVFFMGDDEELNIRNIIALAKDSTISRIAADRRVKHRVYCHARYNGPNRVIQDVALNKHISLKIVDSSHMAVVSSPLKALIVGFGEVGRDAFRFLYEFGSFPGDKSTDADAVKSPVEYVIADKNLADIQGTLKASMPGVFYNGASRDIIRMEAVDYNSDRFNAGVLSDDFLAGLNYVVISIGDNDEAIALATRIFNRVRRLREDLSDLRIFVRCTDDNKVEAIRKVADHYNFGYGKGTDNIPVIRIFGQPGLTYTYDLVVSDRLTGIARKFHEEYRRLSGEGKSWDERHSEMTDTGVPHIDKLRKLRRQESQDMANAFHCATKTYILRRAMGAEVDWQSFCLRYFSADGTAKVTGSRTAIRYPDLSPAENRIILRLAMLEHLRWNAAHELLGYRFNEHGTCCDERTMMHNCLCPWNRLDAKSDEVTGWDCDYKRYDFCVVDTSIALSKDRLCGTTQTK